MGLHWPELLVLIVIALLVFGPKRLPEVGSSIGKTIREFQKSMREVTEPERDATASVTPPVEPKHVAAPLPTAAATTETSAPPVAAAAAETRSDLATQAPTPQHSDD